MKIAVSGGGYRSAADTFAVGNQSAALLHDALADRLGRYAGMAGDDATSAEFAAGYDAAAAEAVEGLHDVVDAYAALGRLTDAAGVNHAEADTASTLPPRQPDPDPAHASDHSGDHATDNATDNGPGRHDAPAYATVLTAVLPSALGGDWGSGAGGPGGGLHLPAEVRWVLDQIEGFVWPGADVDRLRAAASTWLESAGNIGRLQTSCRLAAGQLARQTSPEIPLARAATTDLDTAIDDLATGCHALGTACGQYASDVEDQRVAIVTLVAQLLAESVIISGIGIVLAPVTGGISAAAAASINATRLGWLATRLAAVLARLRALAASVTATLNTLASSLTRIRTRLAPLRRPIPAWARAQPLTNPQLPAGSLTAYEGVENAHTIARHVAKTDAQLLARFTSGELKGKYSSTFTDLSTAEHAIARTLTHPRNTRRIQHWLHSPATKPLKAEGLMLHPVGRTADRTGTIMDTSVVRVLLEKSTAFPAGYRVHTAFPVRSIDPNNWK